MVNEITLAPGEELFAEGESGDRAYIIQDGELEIVKESSGREVLLAVRKRGEVIGEMAILEEEPRMAGARARGRAVLLAIEKDQMDHLLATSITASNAMFRNILGRLRETEKMLRQSERMAQLGTLTAGVAHELNNPAAAVARSTEQAKEAINELATNQSDLGRLEFSQVQKRVLENLTMLAMTQAKKPPELDAVARNDREYALEEWLEDHDVEDGWELAPTLVNLDYRTDCLAEMADNFDSEQLGPVVRWLNSTYNVHNLLTEVGQGATQISQIVRALKSYSYLDQAPVQTIDVTQGIDDTLLMMGSKLKEGVSVRRKYAEGLPDIQAYASELNQVWTNIISNAIDALEGKGEMLISTSLNGKYVVVEITDNGPGIPLEIQDKIFDSFFTTKEPGKGTGLGLDISYRIITDKHRGDIKVISQPGETTFRVTLPINFNEM
jgi:signal transduction histidine kinase